MYGPSDLHDMWLYLNFKIAFIYQRDLSTLPADCFTSSFYRRRMSVTHSPSMKFTEYEGCGCPLDTLVHLPSTRCGDLTSDIMVLELHMTRATVAF